MASSQNSNSQSIKSGFLSRLFFAWLLDLFKLGAQRPLTQDDLYPLQDEYKAEHLVQRLEETWSQEINSANREGRRPKLWKAILRVFPLKKYLISTTLRLTEMFMQFALVVLLWLFFIYLKGESHMEKWHPLLIVLGIGIFSYIRVFCCHHKFYVNNTMGMQLKAAVIGVIYKKILSMTNSNRKKTTTGKIMNLLSNDAQTLEPLVADGIQCVFVVFSFTIGITLLCILVGWQSLSGIGVLFISVFCNYLVPGCYRKLLFKQKQATDHRLPTIKDVISGIRAVKMYALEHKFIDTIKSLRRKEINVIRRQVIFTVIQGCQCVALSPIAITVSIAALLYSNGQVDAVSIFTMALLYNTLCMEVALSCNLYFLTVINGLTSIERIQDFLLISNAPWHVGKTFRDKRFSALPLKTVVTQSCVKILKKVRLPKDPGKDICKKDYSLLNGNDDSDDEKELPYGDNENTQPNVTVKKMSAGWFEDDEQCTLHDISFTTEPNQLLMVTGPVGSGKSTLLMAILREVPIKSGNISAHGKVAYVSQHPWIFTGTVRDNILFGQTFDKNRYQRVLDVCDLNEDISRFPKGDMSVTGQRGVTLSGGQRVRVSLARAIYSNADIYLLDDPLSALDAKVGQYVMDECICNELASRIRILVTHQLQHLHRADNILLMKEGRLLAQGSHKQLTGEGWMGDVLQHDFKSCPENLKEDAEDEMKMKYKTSLMENSCRDMEEEDEDREIGKVTWQVYWKYLRAGTNPVLIGCFMIIYLAIEGSLLAPQLWLSRIAKLPHNQQESFTSLGMLGILVVTAFVLCFVRNCLLYNIFINASKNLHDKMTSAIMKSPVLFFDTNPLGRIMNRFSKDIGCMDNLLPKTFGDTIIACTNILAMLLLTLIINIWFALAVLPLFILVYIVVYYYLRVVRDLKRMESIKCSPIYAHAMETITGLEVVRTSLMQGNFLETMFRLKDENTIDLDALNSAGRWFSLHIDLLFSTFLTAVAGISWATSHDSALAAMVLSLGVGILAFVEYALSLIPEVESQMTSVERVLTYTNLPSEPGYDRNTQPPEDWPTNGALSLSNVSLVYFEGGPRVLRDITLDVKPAEKLGIAGRTGAGKSSLVATLFRMPDPEGSVFIDGVDLGTIHLQAARRSMAVITQDPVLFIGSLRQNLDPFDSLTDMQLWTALEEVQLKKKVLSLDGQLEYTIGEGGSGLSAGERQLLCLARALLQKCKILVLDEATANIDYQTDQLIQQTIRNTFTKCTVLTIAHRLNTIVDYDKVVVIEDGQVVEHDDPRVLAEEENSIFAKLLKTRMTNNGMKT